MIRSCKPGCAPAIVQPHTFYAGLLVFDKTLPQPHIAVVTCSGANVRFTPLFQCTLIFLQLWTVAS